mmetsp:Transcript_54730/g.159624  ORF Transcript_54730/g.159624 Transcript_54730/m.159624 type:complete len:99 (+) Transcript_54730:438-734(+)
MSKTHVNGRHEHAMWTWLKRLCPLPMSFTYGDIRWSPIGPHDIGWNFEKFLFDRDGVPCKRYDAPTPAASLRLDIMTLLGGRCPSGPSWCATSGATRL